MGEFRIGRRFAQHTYPDTPRGGGALAFARNFAMGPATPTTITTGGVQVPWDFIESGAPSGVNVPITPRVTGRMLFSGVVQVTNNDDAPVTVQVQIQVNDATELVPLVQETVDANGEAAIAFEIMYIASLPVGVTAQIQLLVTSTADVDVVLSTDNSTLEIEEKSFATG
jgi:hypothetical protein